MPAEVLAGAEEIFTVGVGAFSNGVVGALSKGVGPLIGIVDGFAGVDVAVTLAACA